ncbi:hypothetical protein EDB86DRAFT_2940469 [Lactarius hatsudake]|nr:hypothetical protein EDB86DRAFT_2940469 [Lactarius hatsudake]
MARITTRPDSGFFFYLSSSITSSVGLRILPLRLIEGHGLIRIPPSFFLFFFGPMFIPGYVSGIQTGRSETHYGYTAMKRA